MEVRGQRISDLEIAIGLLKRRLLQIEEREHDADTLVIAARKVLRRKKLQKFGY